MSSKQQIRILPTLVNEQHTEMGGQWGEMDPGNGACAGLTATDQYDRCHDNSPLVSPTCTGPGCINLNVQRELLHLKQCQTQLRARERSLFRCLARNGLKRANGTVQPFFVEPVLDALEDVYGTADVLARYMAQEHVPGSACQYLSLIEQMEMRLKLYLDSEAVYERYSAALEVVTGRLHGLLPAMSQRRPVAFFGDMDDSRFTLVQHLGITMSPYGAAFEVQPAASYLPAVQELHHNFLQWGQATVGRYC